MSRCRKRALEAEAVLARLAEPDEAFLRAVRIKVNYSGWDTVEHIVHTIATVLRDLRDV